MQIFTHMNALIFRVLEYRILEVLELMQSINLHSIRVLAVCKPSFTFLNSEMKMFVDT